MPSILPGFEYDIFISYRHNDNRSGWVTEFVKHLNEELAAAIKEPVSVYFDSNPHDGLLESHNVDKSLEGKLKCLIFIPIISQTYCDPKSFAWQYEFCVFNKVSKGDLFGRDIKLSSGNVASRILPIKIHDLDAEDKSIIENEIGGVLRPIEFKFNAPGVNRPLIPTDNPDKNQSRTLYRDQINKVANAAKEIISALKNPILLKTIVITEPPAKNPFLKRKYVFLAALLLAILISGYFLIPRLAPAEPIAAIDKSIAVLPFTDMSPGKDQEYLGDGIAEDIITALSRIKELKVIGRTSSFQFKGDKIDLREVGDKLNVSTVLEGSIMKSGNRVRITAQLINVNDGTHIWSERYDKEMNDIFAIQDQISEAISDKMKISLLGNTQVNKERATSNTEAFENYLRGQQILGPDKGQDAIPYFKRAVQLDSSYTDAYAGLASAYFFNWQMKRSERAEHMFPLALKVLELDPASEKSHELLYTYYSNMKWEWKLAEEEYQKYLAIRPIPTTGHALRRADDIGDVKGGIEEMKIGLESDPINKSNLRLIGRLYALDKQFVKAKEMINKSIEIDPYFALGYRTLAHVNILEGDYPTAFENLKKAEEFDAAIVELHIWALTRANRMKEAQEVYASNITNLTNTTDYSKASQAKVEFWMGHLDKGFNLLEQALEDKDADIQSIRFNPQYDVVRDHPRFKEFMKKVNFPD